jgi:hypothetical protein
VHVADVTLLREREAELERAIVERDRALEELRVLRGLLSICSSCKSIRDDKGVWQPIEKYVSEHSHASFSHGICPNCITDQFPDFKFI